jgi:two-component system, LytTR family, response regulator
VKLRCAIVDDEPLALSLLESYVNKTPFLEQAGKYSSAVQAMKELPGNQIDLLFLDIQMPELNGLEFSKMVSPRTRIVFTTAFGQYAIKLDTMCVRHHCPDPFYNPAINQLY